MNISFLVPAVGTVPMKAFGNQQNSLQLGATGQKQPLDHYIKGALTKQLLTDPAHTLFDGYWYL